MCDSIRTHFKAQIYVCFPFCQIEFLLYALGTKGDGDGDGKKSSGGLGIGAIIGIVIGALVLVVVVVVGVWCYKSKQSKFVVSLLCN